ncbi:MAG: hypothetical protein L3J41_15895 [Melioribacteraceae bacterium]|nr:hypothetical protein [Melioribacteraceae bacterium]
MKKLSYYILFLFLIISCKEDKKRIDVPSSSKEMETIDSSSSMDKKIKVDTIAVVEKELVKNVLETKEKQTSYNVKSISELWATYKSSKAKAAKYISENNLDSIIVYLNIAADAAYELSREDIATWQLNNIGYYSINEFKKRTDYDRKMQQLATMKNLKEKGLYLEETKSVFTKHFQILSNAENYLYKAQLLDSELEKSDRTEIINRNIQFIEWVANFISAGNNTNRQSR